VKSSGIAPPTLNSAARNVAETAREVAKRVSQNVADGSEPRASSPILRKSGGRSSHRASGAAPIPSAAPKRASRPLGDTQTNASGGDDPAAMDRAGAIVRTSLQQIGAAFGSLVGSQEAQGREKPAPRKTRDPSAPVKVPQPAPERHPLGDWREVKDPSSGKMYYYHARTKETRWDKPDIDPATGQEVVRGKLKLKAKARKSEAAAAASPGGEESPKKSPKRKKLVRIESYVNQSFGTHFASTWSCVAFRGGSGQKTTSQNGRWRRH
jgi:hypothetical protein